MAPQPANIGLLRAPRQGAARRVLQSAVTKQASSACEIYCRSSRRREQALCGKIARRGGGAALRAVPAIRGAEGKRLTYGGPAAA
jgi:hypothetical protein